MAEEEAKAHATCTSMAVAAPHELDAGTDMALRVRVSCSASCDLRGRTVKIIDQDDSVAEEIELVTPDGKVSETDELLVKAPTEPGEHTWRGAFTPQEKEGILHGESSATFPFIVKPHATSMVVWDAPSPIVLGARFSVKVGVRCSAECRLATQKVEVYDQRGAKVAVGTLADAPWAGTDALYWAEVDLEAPGTEGFYTWEVKFPRPDLELPHEGACCTFGSATAKAAEHVVTVEVIDKDSKTPNQNARVTLRARGGYPYRGRTDESGVARVSVPEGDYELHVLMNDYRDYGTAIEVAGDVALKADMTYWPAHYQ